MFNTQNFQLVVYLIFENVNINLYETTTKRTIETIFDGFILIKPGNTFMVARYKNGDTDNVYFHKIQV